MTTLDGVEPWGPFNQTGPCRRSASDGLECASCPVCTADQGGGVHLGPAGVCSCDDVCRDMCRQCGHLPCPSSPWAKARDKKAGAVKERMASGEASLEAWL